MNKQDLAGETNLCPVRILAGALGNGLPKRDLLVSRQHRMYLSSKIAERMFGVGEVLVAAIKLTMLPGIFVDTDVHQVEYIHFLFDNHELVFAEGAKTESLYLGSQAMTALSPDGWKEISMIFPDISRKNTYLKTARYIPSGRCQKKLIARHRKKQPCCSKVASCDIALISALNLCHTVRRQSYWVQRPLDLSEYLTHLVDCIMRRSCDVASAEFRVFYV